MPTSGEARLKSKNGKTVENGTDINAKKSSALSERNGKTSSLVSVARGQRGKENSEPNADPTSKNGKRFSKVKKAPDFSKLHKKWQNELGKGKAVSKKQNTRIESFNLTEQHRQSQKPKRPYAYNSEDEEDRASDEEEFQIDNAALKGILNNTGIQGEEVLRTTSRATIAAIPSSSSNVTSTSVPAAGGISKRTSIYYTGNPKRAFGAANAISKPLSTPVASQAPSLDVLKPRNVEVASVRTPSTSCVKKQLTWADQVSENDAFDFQPDSQALHSILNNTGINNSEFGFRGTGRRTLDGGRKSHRLGHQLREEPSKRTSIYYTGPPRTRPSPYRLGRATGRTGRVVKTSRKGPRVTAVGVQRSEQQDDCVSVTGWIPKPITTSLAFCSSALSTPARQPMLHAECSSNKWSLRSGNFTPQRDTTTQALVTTRRSPSPVHCGIVLSQTAGLPLSSSQASLPLGWHTPRRAATSQDLDTRHDSCVLPLSAQPSITPFSTPARPRAPAFDTQTSCSKKQPCWAEVLTPQQSSMLPVKQLNLASTQEEEEIAQLERQALEDLRLLRILSGPLNSATTCRSCERPTQIAGNAVIRPSRYNTAINPVNEKVSRSETIFPGFQAATPRFACSSQQSAAFSQNAISTPSVVSSTGAQSFSRFAPPVVLAAPTPVKASKTDFHNSLYSSFSRQRGTQLVVSANMTPSNLSVDSVRSAVSTPLAQNNLYQNFEHGGSSVHLKSAPCVKPTPIRSLSSSFEVACNGSTVSSSYSQSNNAVRPAGPALRPGEEQRPVQIVSPTPKTQLNKHAKSEHASLSLRSAVSSAFSNATLAPRVAPLTASDANATTGARYCWQPSSTESSSSSTRMAASVGCKLSQALAQEVLLDMEVSSYTSGCRATASGQWKQRLTNPLAQMFMEGDSMHFVPISE